MQPSPERKGLVIGFGLAALLMGGISLTSYQNAAQLIESTNKSKQTYTVIQDLMQIFNLMTVAESGRRGYLFLGDRGELSRYRQAIQDIEPALQSLRQDVADAPSQTRRLVQLETLLNQRVDLLDESIDLGEHTASPAAAATPPAAPVAVVSQRQVAITQTSLKLRDEIQTVIAAMRVEEEQLLQQWLQRSQTSIQNRILIEGLLATSIFATLVTVYVLLWRQLSKRQQAELLQSHLAQQQQMNELQRRLFSMVSHEFRTPLTVILGSAQLLTSSAFALTPERTQKNLHRIQSAAKLMTELLNQILTLSRAEVGALEFHPKLVDVEAFCLNLLADLQLTLSPERSLNFTSHGRCGHTNLDDKLLYSILSNLLGNALKYSATTTPVELRLRCQPDATLFEVQDWGKGIAPEDLPHLFEPFHRGQNAAETAGSGLGLAVVKKCVDLHQGAIAVTSTLEQGTTFTVRIPNRPAL